MTLKFDLQGVYVCVVCAFFCCCLIVVDFILSDEYVKEMQDASKHIYDRLANELYILSTLPESSYEPNDEFAAAFFLFHPSHHYMADLRRQMNSGLVYRGLSKLDNKIG